MLSAIEGLQGSMPSAIGVSQGFADEVDTGVSNTSHFASSDDRKRCASCETPIYYGEMNRIHCLCLMFIFGVP